MTLEGVANLTESIDVAFTAAGHGLSLFMQEPLIYLVGACLVGFGIATVKGFFRLKR
jgi:hypothetical protein